MIPSSPSAPGDGRLGAPPTERDVQAALARADSWCRHTVDELGWTDAERTAEAVRADAHERIALTVAAAVDRIGGSRPGDADLLRRARELLASAGWPDDATAALALREARRAWLSERLIAAVRPFGLTDPLVALTDDHGELVERLRRGGDGPEPLELDAQGRHDLDWGAAASLRVAREECGRRTVEDDARLRAAVLASLAGHDEGDRTAAVADRLARRLPASDLPITDTLLAGHLALAAALLADRTGTEAGMVEDWLFAPDPLPVALALRAAGEGAAAIGGALATAAHALGRSLAQVVAATESLHALAPDDAMRLLDAGR